MSSLVSTFKAALLDENHFCPQSQGSPSLWRDLDVLTDTARLQDLTELEWPMERAVVVKTQLLFITCLTKRNTGLPGLEGKLSDSGSHGRATAKDQPLLPQGSRARRGLTEKEEGQEVCFRSLFESPPGGPSLSTGSVLFLFCLHCFKLYWSLVHLQGCGHLCCTTTHTHTQTHTHTHTQAHSRQDSFRGIF